MVHNFLYRRSPQYFIHSFRQKKKIISSIYSNPLLLLVNISAVSFLEKWSPIESGNWLLLLTGLQSNRNLTLWAYEGSEAQEAVTELIGQATTNTVKPAHHLCIFLPCTSPFFCYLGFPPHYTEMKKEIRLFLVRYTLFSLSLLDSMLLIPSFQLHPCFLTKTQGRENAAAI